jgi:hypothetical protein
MRGFLKEHSGVFGPDEVVILLAAFDKSWGLFKPAASDTRQTSSNLCGRYSRSILLRPQWKASATWAGCATVLYSPWLNQICEAGRRANSAS